jgi:ATP-binding cassette subfamily F protein uup
MSCLINCQNISKRYSFKPLFQGLSFSIHQGDRLGLIGNNGVGKSTLLKILTHQENPDDGQVTRSKGLKIALIHQFPEFDDLSPLNILLHKAPQSPEEALIFAESLLTQAGLDQIKTTAHHLSGGQKKKLDILKALIQEPDVIFLDEPTNHLDLESVLWLENFLSRSNRTLVVVSHDRTFLSRVCDQFMEINTMFPEGNFHSKGSLEDFFDKKNIWIEGERKRMQSLSQQVDQEIAWMKRSPKARTTKSVYRSQKALDLEQDLKTLKSNLSQNTSQIKLSSSERESRLLIQAKNLTKSLGDKILFKGLDLVLSPGKIVGLLGPNGCGKTTLLKLLAGLIQPDLGTIKYADKLEIVYFDQHKMQLNPKDLVKDVLSPNGEFVDYLGQSIHVNGWAKRFLFTQDTLRLPVEKLSGGEKSRLLIAKLMLKKADILLLDEPTNDLDIQTLELLEESLKDFPGSCVIISHDRYFLNQVCDYYLALADKPEGQVYHTLSDWEQNQKKSPPKIVKEEKEKPPVIKPRLSSKELKELRTVEEEICKNEAKIKVIEQKIADLESTASLALRQELYQELGLLHQSIETLFSRWEELDNKKRV